MSDARNMLIGQIYGLVLATFSVLLILFGVSSMGMMTWTVVANSMTSSVAYYPPLPILQDQTDSFVEIPDIPPRQIYPSLSNLEDVEDGNWIKIPSIGVKVPLINSPTMSDVDVVQTLNLGAALYPNGILPGRLGNLFVSAHSTGEPWKGAYRFAFIRINELMDNNLIHVDFEGARYTYRIVDKNIIEPSSDISIQSESSVPTVTLMACWPLWSTKQRMLISGELVHITKLTVSPT